MKSGFLVMCDRQTVRGWCILLAAPVVGDLDELSEEGRVGFLSDMAAAGEAIKRVTGAYRMNYSILGNTDAALHAHIQPRFIAEPERLRRQPLWAIWGEMAAVEFDVARDRGLMEGIRGELEGMGRCKGG